MREKTIPKTFIQGKKDDVKGVSLKIKKREKMLSSEKVHSSIYKERKKKLKERRCQKYLRLDLPKEVKL